MKSPRFFSGYSWLAVGTFLIVLLGAAWFTARQVAGDWLNAQLVERYNRSAREELARGEAANALVLARRSLQRAPDNLAAWRLAADAARRRDQPDALYYQENLARLQPNKANTYEFIRLALHFGLDGDAVRRIKTIAASGANDPAYLRLAVQAYLRVGNSLAARFHLISLTELVPDDTDARLELALIDLAAGAADRTPELRETIRRLAEFPALRSRALTGLLQESIRSRQAKAGLALIPALEGEAESNSAVRLLLLEATYAFSPGDASARLSRLQQAVAARAADAAGLIDFMAARGEESAAVAWTEGLPAATRQSEDVRRALADCYLRLEAWDRLRAVALEGEWPEREFLRRALLAYSYRAQNRRTEFTEAWKGAAQLAGASFNHTRELLARIEAWRWRRERFDLLWKLFALLPGNSELRREIAAWEHLQGNTANLQRLFGEVIELAPGDLENRANFAYCSLLLDTDITGSAATFRELAAQDPQSPYYTTGLALALLKQDRPAPALAALTGLRPAYLAVPQRMCLHVWLLVLNGRINEAESLLESLVTDGLLPEEKKWAENARQEIARHHLNRGRESLLAARSEAMDRDDAQGWIALVRPQLGSTPTVDMRLSDRLLARRDLPALARLVRSGDWLEREYLRLALLAFAIRAEDPAGAREAWTHALTCARQETDGAARLESLAASWSWVAEQIEALNVLHQQAPVDRNRLTRLLDYYRARQRTADMIRVLRHWVERAPDSEEAVVYTYYCLLTNVETSRAMVAAKEALDAHPADPDRILLYAFALDRAGRSVEAGRLILSMPELPARTLSIPLISAVIWANTGNAAEASRAARRFDATQALPEESVLLRKITPQATRSP